MSAPFLLSGGARTNADAWRLFSAASPPSGRSHTCDAVELELNPGCCPVQTLLRNPSIRSPYLLNNTRTVGDDRTSVNNFLL